MTNVPARLVSLRRHPQDASGGAVGEQPQRAVGPDAHVADALAQVLQQALFLAHLLAVELEAYQCLSGERADEQVAAPRREQVAGIERHAGRRDRWHPILDRLLHAGLLGAGVDFGATVVDTVADHRPSVVFAGFRDVDLIAAARAVLVHPQLAAGWVERGALRVAVAIAPDL